MYSSFVILAFPFLLSAQSVWNLPGNGDWGTAGNWTPSGIPDAIDQAVQFNLAGAATVNLTTGSYTIGNLTSTTSQALGISNGTLKLKTSTGSPVIDIFGSTTTISGKLESIQGFEKKGAGVLTLTGANSSLGGTVKITAGRIYVNTSSIGTADYEINSTSAGTTYLRLLDSGTYTNNMASTGSSGYAQLGLDVNNKAYVINNTITVASGTTFRGRDLVSTSTANWTGTLKGSGAFALTNGDGVHTLNMDMSDFSGNFLVGGGGTITAIAARDNAFGGVKNGVKNTLTIGTNNAIISDGTTARTFNSNIIISGNQKQGLFGFDDSDVKYGGNTGKLTFKGGYEVNISGGQTNTLKVRGTQMVVEIEGAITMASITSTFEKAGVGTLILSADSGSDYAGNTLVSEGTLLINGNISAPRAGSGIFTVSSDAKLGGVGTIINRNVTVGAGGILAPGDSTKVDTTGTLTVNSDVTFEQGAIFRLELNSDTAYDKIVMGSMYDLTFNGLGATLDLHLNNQFDFLEDMEFIIAEGFGNLSGKFAGINEDDIFTSDGVAFRMNYFTDSIKLTVVPEPSTLVLLGLVLTGALVFRRRRG